jgi:hypothetical protein
MPRLKLYPFRYRSVVTGKWTRARYVAEREVIEQQYREFEILGPPQIRDVDEQAASFNPYRSSAPRLRYPVYEAG